MFGRFLKPRWQHQNPAIRSKAIEALDLEEDASLLAQLARGDASASVRAAAVSRLLDFNLLDEVNRLDGEPSVRQAASSRMMALLAGTVDEAPSTDNRLRMIRLTSNPRVLQYVAENSPDQACRLAAVSNLSDDDLLYKLALSAADEPLRLAAAERISSLTLLKRLGREGRDKRVIRFARETAKALQEAEHEREAAAAKVAYLIKSIKQHTHRSVDNLYAPRLEQLEQQWEAVASEALADQKTEVQQAFAICREKLDAQNREEQARAREEALNAERKAAVAALETLLQGLTAESWQNQLGDLRSAIATQQRRWETAHDEAPASSDEQQAFSELLLQWQTLLGLAAEIQENADQPAVLEELAKRWPAAYPRPPALESLATEEPSPENKANENADKSAAEKKHRRHTPHQGLLVALKRELRQGNLRHANRLWHKAQALVEEHGDEVLARELNKLEARREELQDWHAFAANPKKESLCERMEALVGAEMDAPQLATAIQALHDEWRELMSSDQEQDHALWDRFKAASDRAYQPCRSHFAEQDAIKAQNLEKRKALCDQLDEYIAAQDWENADWAAVWEIRRQAPVEWKSLQPIRFTDGREVQRRFSALLTAMDERLDKAVEHATEARQALLDEATELADADDPVAATETAKALQRRWRETPWLPPARHRSMQRKFRKIMDGIFAARNAVYEERKAARQQQQSELEASLDQLEQLLALPLAEHDKSATGAAMKAVQAHEGTALPRGLIHRRDKLLARAKHSLVQVSRWQAWHELMQQLDQIAQAESDDEAARELAVAVEALAGVDSPEDQKARRLQWQLEQLPHAMKRHDFDAMDEATTLITRYEGPVSAQTRERLKAAIAALEPHNA